MALMERNARMWRYILSTSFLGKNARRTAVMCFVFVVIFCVVQPISKDMMENDIANKLDKRDISDTITLQLTKEEISRLLARTNLKTNVSSSVVETKRAGSSIIQSNNFYEEDDEEDAKTPIGIKEDSDPPAGSPKSQKHSWPAILPPSNAGFLRQLDYSKYTTKEREFLQSRIPVYEERARTAAAACAARPEVIQELKSKVNMVWDTKHQPNIVHCPNFKVASTTMMIYFLRLGHFNENNPEILKLPEDQREEARFLAKYGAKHPKVFDLFPTPKSDEEKYKVFTNALRVILVRHPFTRILSAYRDKMVRMNPRPAQFNFRDVQLNIIKKYRPKDSKETSPHPTFAEFAQYVIDTTRKMRTMKDWRKVNCWQPYWVQCSSCNKDHNVIMKLETMKEDERFLFTISDLKELKQLKQSEWRHLQNVSSTDAAPDFYRQLTRRQMTDLYNSYKLDFQIYGYTIQNYLDIAKDT
ncbi:unnamed protein product, partial [Meganyctiphanes norvegica]